MSMKKIVNWVVLCLVLLRLPIQAHADGPATPTAAVSTEGYLFSVKVVKESVESMEPIMLNIVITNSSSKSLPFYRSPMTIYGFDIAVNDNQGERMPLTRYGDALIQSLSQKTRYFNYLDQQDIPQTVTLGSLSAGESVTYKFLLNRIYDMTRNDRYFVVVTRAIPIPDTATVLNLTSNTVKVQVGSMFN